MNLRVVLLALLTSTVALAGCTSDEPTNDQVLDGGADEDNFQLKAGKGAISGLLVDDRFRPIELTDDPNTEFQRTGFILLQELGLRAQTDANGEFSFVDLDPGQYTLRAQIDGHEATPERVTVSEGLFAESTLLARRVLSQGSFILTQEHTVYIACALDFIANGINLPCDLDLSDDSYSSDFGSDYQSYGSNATAVVTELLANQDKSWELQVRTGTRYYIGALASGTYIKVYMENGVNAEEFQNNVGYADRYQPWLNDDTFQTIFFIDHGFRQEHQDVLGPTLCCGAGLTVGIRSTILQSVFLGVPEVDIEDYCVLC